MTAVPGAVPDLNNEQEVRKLRVWQRFHVAITALYGIPIYLVLTAMSLYNYDRGVTIEMDALKARLHGMSVTLATTLGADPYLHEPTVERAESLRIKFAAIAAEEPDISSIYMFRQTGHPGSLEFVADWVREGEPGHPGQLYDAHQAPRLMQTFTDGPQTEDDIYTDEWGPVISGYAPVAGDGMVVGVVGVDVKAERVSAIKREVLFGTLLVYLIASAILFGLARIVGHNIRTPLVRIIDATQAIVDGRLDARAALDRRDEFGILGRHFDGMAQGLQEKEVIRDTFGRYMSERLAKRLLGSPDGTQLGGHEIDVTILFADLRSYSTISEHLSPTQTVEMLNEYMGAMSDVVDQHRGLVIEILGDGILAVFGALDEDVDHPTHAVECAISMTSRLRALNGHWRDTGLAKLWESAGIAELKARIGVHSGQVVAGNMGGPRRMKYAVIGDAVNVAARVEALNTELGSDVLCTETTWKRLAPRVKNRVIERGAHAVKGREQKVAVYSYTFGDPAKKVEILG